MSNCVPFSLKFPCRAYSIHCAMFWLFWIPGLSVIRLSTEFKRPAWHFKNNFEVYAYLCINYRRRHRDTCPCSSSRRGGHESPKWLLCPLSVSQNYEQMIVTLCTRTDANDCQDNANLLLGYFNLGHPVYAWSRSAVILGTCMTGKGEKKGNEIWEFAYRLQITEERLYGAPVKSHGAPHVLTTWRRAWTCPCYGVCCLYDSLCQLTGALCMADRNFSVCCLKSYSKVFDLFLPVHFACTRV